MFKNSSMILFTLILMMGSLITISSNSWLSAWMGLEINLLSFIPLMNNNTDNLMSTEASLKYFLIQALASSILLFSIILIYLKFNMNYLLMKKFKYIQILMISTLFLKTGAAPFHFWFPTVMEGLSWMNSLILMTWQKIAPMMLISYFNEMKFMLIIVIFSTMIGALGGLNQTSLRKIMAYSSINHLGWMILAMMINDYMWLFYFLTYCFLSMNLIYLFNLFKIFHINQLFCMFFNSKIMKFTFFLPKWMIIEYLTFNNQLFILLIVIMSTLITLFFYIRLCYSAFMLNYYEIAWNYTIINKFMFNIYLIFSFISIFNLFIISMMYYIY